MDNFNQKTPISVRIDRSSEPNLIINYTSINPSVLSVVAIKAIRQKVRMLSGQTLSFHMPQGEHVIVIKIGKINYKRLIVIPPNNQPVRINASFTGRAQIHIDQPTWG